MKELTHQEMIDKGSIVNDDSGLNTRPNDAKAMIAEMDKIQEEYPLDHIFTDDARYTWPERWKKLREVCKQSEGSE